ncbi:hypothetical protein J4E81_002576 [Alternaria sp. BMP 2799]|nr:hypothetical protein J4E81_002576 [Alternaria sp. BMP 2799]
MPGKRKATKPLVNPHIKRCRAANRKKSPKTVDVSQVGAGSQAPNASSQAEAAKANKGNRLLSLPAGRSYGSKASQPTWI